MARFLFIVVFLAVIFSSPLSAAEYKPGTVGHLYEDCRQALEHATKLSDLQETYCGSFAEGYSYGALASNGVALSVAPDDPCVKDKEREYTRINKRFCENFPRMDAKGTTTGDVLKAATTIVTRWIGFEKAASKSDPLRRGTLREVNNLIQPGPFCDDLVNEDASAEPPMIINPALTKTNFQDYMKAKKGLSVAAKYERCRQDVAQAAGDPAVFLSTKCGAEISGYISGLHSTEHLQKNRAEPAKECKKEIDRLYKNLDVTKTMCVSYDTNPLWVAEIFIKKYPELKIPKSNLGSIGELTIYRGFLCAEERKGN